MPYIQKKSMIAGTDPVKEAKKKKKEVELRDFTGDPTTEGTHFEEEVNLSKMSGLGPRTSFGGVKNPELDPTREAEDTA